MRLKKYSDDEFKSIVKKSTSIRQVLTSMGRAPHGGNYLTARRRIKRLNLSTEHFIGQGWSRGKRPGPKYPLEDYLSNKRYIGSYKLRMRLITEGIFEAKCCRCLRSEWQGQPMPLELEHIDGNSENNNLDNLTILCPNCHALTPTYWGRNIGSKS